MSGMTSADFEPRGGKSGRCCGFGGGARWSAWEIGAVVAAFVVFWPLGLIALFLKWKNGELWRGSADQAAPWAGMKMPDFSAWKPSSAQSSYGFSGSGNAAFDEYRREQLRRLDEERRKLEEEQKAFRDFVEKLRRAKDQDEFDRFMAERNIPPHSGN